jgi:photosystem II stability/assembly factor-like uncharacterized protein
MRLLLSALLLAAPLFGEEPAAAILPKAAEGTVSSLVHVGEELIAVGERGHAFHWDGGLVQEPFPAQSYLTSVATDGKGNAWAVGYDSVIALRSAETHTWEIRQRLPEQQTPFFSISFLDSQHGIAVGAYGLVYHTIDGGAQWQQLQLTEEDPHLFQAKSDGSTWTLAGEFGTVMQVSKTGELIKSYETGVDYTFFGIEMLGEENWIAYGLLGRVFIYSEGVIAQLLVPKQRSLYGSLVLDGGVLLFGGDGTILYYKNGKFTDHSIDERLDMISGIIHGDQILIGTLHGIRSIPISKVVQ